MIALVAAEQVLDQCLRHDKTPAANGLHAPEKQEPDEVVRMHAADSANHGDADTREQQAFTSHAVRQRPYHPLRQGDTDCEQTDGKRDIAG